MTTSKSWARSCWILLSLIITDYSLAFDTQTSSIDRQFDTPLRIAVAANFKPVLEQLVASFEQATNQSVEISSGSTGALYAQIRNGAPFDIFFAADSEKPSALDDAGLARHRQTYVYGRLAFWMPGADKVNESVLRHFDAALAIANPLHAPYGQAAMALLNNVGRNDIKLIRGSNIALTYTFVATGNVAGGLVALSQLTIARQDEASYWIVPVSFHQPIEQQLVILNAADTRADDFVEFIGDERSRAVIAQAGYTLPGIE